LQPLLAQHRHDFPRHVGGEESSRNRGPSPGKRQAWRERNAWNAGKAASEAAQETPRERQSLRQKPGADLGGKRRKKRQAQTVVTRPLVFVITGKIRYFVQAAVVLVLN
jgi:hypothetical protein